MDLNYELDWDRLRVLANRLERILELSVSGWSIELCVRARGILQSCASDAERLVLLDWTYDGWSCSPWLFVDDCRDDKSSPAVGLLSVRAMSNYVASTGVVYECGSKSKSFVATCGISQAGRTRLACELAGALQGGTPAVGCASVFLGSAEDSEKGDALATLEQIVQRGAWLR